MNSVLRNRRAARRKLLLIREMQGMKKRRFQLLNW